MHTGHYKHINKSNYFSVHLDSTLIHLELIWDSYYRFSFLHYVCFSLSTKTLPNLLISLLTDFLLSLFFDFWLSSQVFSSLKLIISCSSICLFCRLTPNYLTNLQLGYFNSFSFTFSMLLIESLFWELVINSVPNLLMSLQLGFFKSSLIKSLSVTWVLILCFIRFPKLLISLPPRFLVTTSFWLFKSMSPELSFFSYWLVFLARKFETLEKMLPNFLTSLFIGFLILLYLYSSSLWVLLELLVLLVSVVRVSDYLSTKGVFSCEPNNLTSLLPRILIPLVSFTFTPPRLASFWIWMFASQSELFNSHCEILSGLS